MQVTDPAISEQAAADFVARVAGHTPPGTALRWPLVVGADPDRPGAPGCVMDGSGAMWTLPAGDDSTERYRLLNGGGVEVVKYRNGNEVNRATFG